MDFIGYASSSKGNLYEVRSHEGRLLLECGLPIGEIRRRRGFSLAADACLLTHEHQDHARAAADLLRAGVDIHCSRGTANALGLQDFRLRVLEQRPQWVGGGWLVLPFMTQHDAVDPLGFLIGSSYDLDKLLFAVDTGSVPYRFVGLTHICIECNWASDLIPSTLSPQHRARLEGNHMSLEGVLSFLAGQDLSAVREIHLLHLSREHSDAERFKREVEAATGRPVYVAAE
jgi:phosphoribosyl 1,2-cyclic phosphodiesterase